MSVKTHLLAFSLLFTATTASADWTGGIDAGASFGSNNRPALRFFANNSSDPLSHYIYLDWIRESSGSDFRVGYNPTFRISHSIYSFGRFSVEQDDPSGIERDIEGAVGLGNNLFQRGNTRVKIEGGVGAQHLRFADDSSDETDGYVFVSSSLASSVLTLLRFDASISAEVNDQRSFLEGVVGLSVPIAPGTQLRYVYRDQRYNFDDRENIDDQDTFFTISRRF